MPIQPIDRAESLRAYPTMSAAARMIGVSPSTLSRRDDCEPLQRGSRDHVLPPAEVMRLAAIYRKRSLNEVAADLVALGAQHGPQDHDRVEDAVEAFFAGRSRSESVDEFLAQAKRHLPSKLYQEVRKTVREGDGPPADIVGHVPKPTPGKPQAQSRSARSRAVRKAS
ncbi:MAG: hypothetical protein JWR63_515 [Conexibacter sp.]|nr:hypothetical protein [Conexibacter sp.]